MIDVLLEFGADINARSQFWGRTVGVPADGTPEIRACLIERGGVPEIDRRAPGLSAGCRD
jgi:hypothetical protein